MTSATMALRLSTRVRAGLGHSANWWQAVRFLAVGASGFAINLVTFAALVHGADVDYRLAAVCSNALALTSNFLLNRRWTFRATAGAASMQAPRFAFVSACGLLVNIAVLYLGVGLLSLPRLPGEVLASAVATPVNFLGSRQWAFAAARRRGGG
jgi:putative flippase GtrA